MPPWKKVLFFTSIYFYCTLPILFFILLIRVWAFLFLVSFKKNCRKVVTRWVETAANLLQMMHLLVRALKMCSVVANWNVFFKSTKWMTAIFRHSSQQLNKNGVLNAVHSRPLRTQQQWATKEGQFCQARKSREVFALLLQGWSRTMLVGSTLKREFDSLKRYVLTWFWGLIEYNGSTPESCRYPQNCNFTRKTYYMSCFCDNFEKWTFCIYVYMSWTDSFLCWSNRFCRSHWRHFTQWFFSLARGWTEICELVPGNWLCCSTDTKISPQARLETKKFRQNAKKLHLSPGSSTCFVKWSHWSCVATAARLICRRWFLQEIFCRNHAESKIRLGLIRFSSMTESGFLSSVVFFTVPVVRPDWPGVSSDHRPWDAAGVAQGPAARPPLLARPCHHGHRPQRVRSDLTFHLCQTDVQQIFTTHRSRYVCSPFFESSSRLCVLMFRRHRSASTPAIMACFCFMSM